MEGNMPDETKRQTTIFILDTDAEVLRRLAAALDIRIPKGPGAGDIGSLRDFNHRLASAGRVRFDELVEALRPFIAKDEDDV
jgi:hypothetical protein